MDSAVIGAIVTQIGAILIASGGWYFGAKRDREKTREAMLNEMQKVRGDLTDMGANLQQKISIIELSLSHTNENLLVLSDRTDKHNQVIERVYRCEDNDRLLDERIKVGNHRLDDLENAVRDMKK